MSQELLKIANVNKLSIAKTFFSGIVISRALGQIQFDNNSILSK